MDLNEIYRSIGNSKKAWVNTQEGIMPLYKKIKDKIYTDEKGSINIDVTGGEWGLACNAISFIDLFEWLTDSKVEDIDSSSIKFWKPSKRIGFVEAIGSITIYFSDKSKLRLECR